METSLIDQLYLELSQVAKVKTRREIQLENFISSVQKLAEEKSADSDYHWPLIGNEAKRILGNSSQKEPLEEFKTALNEIKSKFFNPDKNKLAEHFKHEVTGFFENVLKNLKK